MALERSWNQIQSTFIKTIALTEVHRKNCLKWTQDNRATNWEQVIFSDETTIRLNAVKRLVWNLSGKKKIGRTVKHSIKENVWGCFSSQSFARIVCFKQNFNAESMCDIDKRGCCRKVGNNLVSNQQSGNCKITMSNTRGK